MSDNTPKNQNNKTRGDDILMEMIQPKITEIETKFSKGEGLSQDDINTLLLKSQYNHINHLDDKLNEVTSSVVNLESKFELLKTDLYGEFGKLEAKFGGLEAKFGGLEEKVEKAIAKALNKNMVLLIAVMGLFLTLSQLIDKLL